MTENSLTLKLSREELIAAMSLAGVRGLPGLGTNVFEGLNENQVTDVISAGVGGLRARDLLRDQPGSNGEPALAVDQTLMALVGTCAMAPRILFFNRIPLGGPLMPWYIHVGPYLTVIHRLAQVGVDELFASVSADEVLAEVRNFLALDDTSPEGALIQAPADAYETALKATQEGQIAQALQALRQAGFEPESAHRLVELMRQPVATTLCSLSQLKGEGAALHLDLVDRVVVMQSAGQTWTVRNNDPSIYRLQPVTSASVLRLLRDWLASSQ